MRRQRGYPAENMTAAKALASLVQKCPEISMAPGRRLNISEALQSSPLGQNPSTADLGSRVRKDRIMANRSEAPKGSSEAQAIDGLPVIRRNVAGVKMAAGGK